jgi:hypothetical protein
VLSIALLCLATVAPDVQDRPRIDPALVERFRALTPEQKLRLKERVEALRKLSPEERRRLTENLDKFRAMAPERQKALRERMEKMNPDERKRAAELATGFFRWMNARYGEVRFPRSAFFRWTAARKPEAFEELKALDPLARTDAFLKLAHEYRVVRLQQLHQHARRHRCATPAELKSLEDEDFGTFWEAAEKFVRRCSPKPPPPPKSPDRKPR